MKNYKLICLDLDGTLLTSKHKLNTKTVEYLKKLVNNGIYVSITTGRANYDAKYHANQIGEETYFVASNGASFGQNNQENLFYEESLDEESVNKIIEVCNEFKIKPVFYTRKHILILSLKNYVIHVLFVLLGAKHLRKYLKFFTRTKNLIAFYKNNNYMIQKAIIFISDNDDIERMKDLLGHDQFDIAVTVGFCIEITPKGINKAHGIKELISKLDIDSSEVIAFGDSENDIEMLKYVGMGVAMGNADDSVKEIADEVTGTNDEDGIYCKLVEIFGEL